MNDYEAIFILKATLSNEALETAVEGIKGVITKNKGEVTQSQSWGKRKLAYLIQKQAEGVYYLFDFKLAATAVKKIESVFKINDLILRTLIVRKV
ncbi:MAG: 30S ribosomal protein S6 [PVC group bacterium]|nr:30S ribosomal protein S6 [PVC group bacterium]